MNRSPLPLLCILCVVMLSSSCCSSLHSVVQEGREIIEVDRGPDGLAWVVQLTDLHFSSYRPDRASSFQTLMGPLLALIDPSLVLITGDLTDAKSKDLIRRRQDENEWILYRKVISRVISESGLPDYAFYDLRGNHDKFGVPTVGSRLDYFSQYSVSSMRNRTGTVQSVTLESSGWKHLFVGVDTSMSIGLRGPCNFFGHPTEEQLAKIDLELGQWDSSLSMNITKIVFGHFPMSFTASTEGGSRLECVFAKHSIAAYVCGHLHKSFGSNLIKHHYHFKEQTGSLQNCGSTAYDRVGEFWEWELGDWRMRRFVRIITLDQGRASFTDFDMSFLNASDLRSMDVLPTFIVPTYPLDSQRMERSAQQPHFMSIQKDVVRALVFSQQPLVSVVARFYEISAPYLLEELEMHLTTKIARMGYVYEAQWERMKYKESSGKRYSFQVSTVDAAGKYTESSLRPFSAERKTTKLKKTWKEFFVMDLVWEEVFRVLVFVAFASLFIFFILPRFFLHLLLGNGRYQRWSYHLFTLGKQKLTASRFLQIIAWFFIQGCANNVLWVEQLTVLILLIASPWFWGQVLADGHPVGFMSLKGWEVHLNQSLPPFTGLGWPDLMMIVLPYLYFVILPVYTLICALLAEASLHEMYQMEMPAGLQKKDMIAEDSELKSLMPYGGGKKGHDVRKQEEASYDSKQVSKPKAASWRWVRLLLIGCFLIVSFIHVWQVCAVAGAHGPMVVFASPGFSWPVPVLMITAVLQSSQCRQRN